MKRIACMALGLAALAASGGASAYGEHCAWPEPVVDAGASPVPHYKFAYVDDHWTLARVFARLGPARRAVGELAYEWVDDEGRVFTAAASSRCGLLNVARFADRGPPGR